MPRYTKEDLYTIARALYLKGFIGLANTVAWWHSDERNQRKCQSRDYTIMKSPLKDMPLYLSDESESIRVIAVERLKLRR